MNKKIITSCGLILSSIIALVGLYICSPVCTKLVELANGNMTYMKCHYTSQIATIVSVIILVIGIEKVFSKNKFYFIIILLGVIMLSITFKLSFVPGVCKSNTMACNSTIIWLRISGCLTILVGLIEIFLKETK